MKPVFAGLWPPVSTPFRADGAFDEKRLVAHGKRLLADGAHGLAVLGTTSEANSLTLDERRRAIDALVEGGVKGSQLLPGTGACAVGDAATLNRHAGELGAAGVLLLPPFYYKKVTDDGIFNFVAAVIEKSGPKVPKVMLYHIPPMASIGWSVDLVGRLRDAFPDVIAGMKDSSGDAEHTKKMVESFPDLDIFPGAEVYLLKALSWGARGCISATANINAYGIRRLLDRHDQPDAPKLQEEVNAVRKAAEARVMIPSLKAVLAERYGDPVWLNVRPPLVKISETHRAELIAEPAIRQLLEMAPA